MSGNAMPTLSGGHGTHATHAMRRATSLERSVGRMGNRLPLDLAQRIERGALLGFFLAIAPGRRKSLRSDDGRDLEALRVIGALLVEHLIKRCRAELLLRHLLQHALVVA